MRDKEVSLKFVDDSKVSLALLIPRDRCEEISWVSETVGSLDIQSTRIIIIKECLVLGW